MSESDPILGIDLGGTKIEGIVLRDVTSLDVLERLRVPTESDQGYEHIVHQIKLCVDLIERKTGKASKRIGIGTPGVLDPTLTDYEELQYHLSEW